jgi:hypothetical protein
MFSIMSGRPFPEFTLSILELCQRIENTPIGTGIREGAWSFSLIESTHALGIILMAGTIMILDLRLVGLTLRKERVSDIAQQVLPWTWIGFALMFITGSLLVWAETVKCYKSTFFRIKLVLLLLAAVNALAFHRTMYRAVSGWEHSEIPPPRARLAGLLSLTLWITIIAAGRAMGYETIR